MIPCSLGLSLHPFWGVLPSNRVLAASTKAGRHPTSLQGTACMGLVWGFSCQGGRGTIFCFFLLLFLSLVRPRPQAFFRPDRQEPKPPRAVAVKDGALLQRRRRLVLDGREHGGMLRRSGTA